MATRFLQLANNITPLLFCLILVKLRYTVVFRKILEMWQVLWLFQVLHVCFYLYVAAVSVGFHSPTMENCVTSVASSFLSDLYDTCRPPQSLLGVSKLMKSEQPCQSYALLNVKIMPCCYMTVRQPNTSQRQRTSSETVSVYMSPNLCYGKNLVDRFSNTWTTLPKNKQTYLIPKTNF